MPIVTPPWRLTVVTAPTDTPVSLQEAKDWARIDGDDDDALLRDLILRVSRQVEEITRRALMTQTLRLSVDGVPAERWLELPRPPLVSVDSFVYFDLDGTQKTYDFASNTSVITTSEPGRILLKNGKTWPTAPRAYDSLRIVYTAGYSDRENVPQGLRMLLLDMVVYAFDNRSSGSIPAELRPELQSWRVPY